MEKAGQFAPGKAEGSAIRDRRTLLAGIRPSGGSMDGRVVIYVQNYRQRVYPVRNRPHMRCNNYVNKVRRLVNSELRSGPGLASIGGAKSPTHAPRPTDRRLFWN